VPTLIALALGILARADPTPGWRAVCIQRMRCRRMCDAPTGARHASRLRRCVLEFRRRAPVSRLRVRDLMTSDVAVVHPDDSVARLRDVMSGRYVRHVPVVDEDRRLVGLVSERDLIRWAGQLEAQLPLTVGAEVAAAVKVHEVMVYEPETVDADDDVVEAATVMLESKYGCLPVLEQGVLVGILTEADFVRYVAESTSRTADDPLAGGTSSARSAAS